MGNIFTINRAWNQSVHVTLDLGLASMESVVHGT